MEKKVITEIKYKVFYNTLKRSDYGYTDEEIRNLFLSARAMDEESRGWVISWMKGRGLPKAAVEDVSADFLVKNVGMQPLNALIALDWLKQEPEMAKYYIMKFARDDSENDAAKADMKKMVEEIRKEKRLGDMEYEKKEMLENVEELTLEGVI